MKLMVTVELEHVSGPTQDRDVMIDAFAAKIGRDNTADPPLRVETVEWIDGEDVISVYEVKCVS
jgi:hypothetical protein